MDKATKENILAAMESVAERHGASVQYVFEHISSQIKLGLSSPDPDVRSLWRRIPSTGSVPTPEEAVGYFTAVYLGLIQ